MATISVTVNGRTYQHEVEPRLLLVHYLRDVLGLTGTHVGCDTSQCGVCTVSVDGKAVKPCTLFAVQAAFREHHGLQCGFCTPGMVMSAVDLLKKNPDPDEGEIREWLEGNICRCTGYHNIVKAVQNAAHRLSQTRDTVALPAMADPRAAVTGD